MFVGVAKKMLGEGQSWGSCALDFWESERSLEVFI